MEVEAAKMIGAGLAVIALAGVGVGNGRGWDFLNGPSSKRYGISIKASF